MDNRRAVFVQNAGANLPNPEYVTANPYTVSGVDKVVIQVGSLDINEPLIVYEGFGIKIKNDTGYNCNFHSATTGATFDGFASPLVLAPNTAYELLYDSVNNNWLIT